MNDLKLVIPDNNDKKSALLMLEEIKVADAGLPWQYSGLANLEEATSYEDWVKEKANEKNALDLEEQEQRKLLTIISTGEKYRRKNEKRTPRNEEGLTPKQAELKELKLKVLELKGKGLSNRAIARELNCSEGKIRTILKKVSA